MIIALPSKVNTTNTDGLLCNCWNTFRNFADAVGLCIPQILCYYYVEKEEVLFV